MKPNNNFLSHRRWKAFALSIGAIFFVSNVCPSTEEEISLMPVKFELTADARLGKKTSGIICGPSGSWYWRDLNIDRETVDAAIRLAFSSVGLKIANDGSGFGDAPVLKNYRLRARVQKFLLDACVPWKATGGMLGAKGVRGSGSLTVTWELYSSIDRKIVSTIEVHSEFRAMKGSDHTALFVKALESNVAKLPPAWLESCSKNRAAS